MTSAIVVPPELTANQERCADYDEDCPTLPDDPAWRELRDHGESQGTGGRREVWLTCWSHDPCRGYCPFLD